MYKVKSENVYYLFKLENLLKVKDISIDKLVRDTNTDFKVIKRIMIGDLLRLGIIIVARFWDYLNCSISDIGEYFPNKKYSILYLA